MNKLTALIEAAEAATPGPWWSGTCEPADGHALAWIGVHFVDCEGGQRNYKEQESDATFIALANPATILELCALLEKAEEALERMCIVTTNGAEGGMLNMGSLEGRTTFYDLLRTEKVMATEALAAIKQWKEE